MGRTIQDNFAGSGYNWIVFVQADHGGLNRGESGTGSAVRGERLGSHRPMGRAVGWTQMHTPFFKPKLKNTNQLIN